MSANQPIVPRVAVQMSAVRNQGCQIFLGTKYQNGKN
jgi:hypothetical protein